MMGRSTTALGQSRRTDDSRHESAWPPITVELLQSSEPTLSGILLRCPLAARHGQAVSAYRTWRIDLINMAPAVPVQSARRARRCARPPTDPPPIPGPAAKGRTSMRALLRLSLAVMALAVLAPAVLSQQAFPTHPIRLIVPYPAGGATDVVARIVAEKMSEELGQQIHVDNRPGAGTMIGDTGTYALNPTLYDKQLTYDPIKDFAPVSRTGRVPLILVANPNTIKVNSVKELIEAAKKAPGKIDYGAPGPGSPIHLAMELFKQRVGINATAIPYKGGADALTDLLGGRIALLFVDAATGVTHIKSGALKALGAGTDKRIPAAPDVPTIAEAGVPDFEASAWNGLAVPAGTPPEIIAKLSAACQIALGPPAVKQRLAELSVEPAPTSADEFGAYIKSETAKWRTVITEAGISLK